MCESKKNVLEMDFVYEEKGTKEFRNLHITANIPNDTLVINIESAEPILEEDLEHVLCSLQKNNFKKLRLNIFEDCEIFLVAAGNSIKVTPAKINKLIHH